MPTFDFKAKDKMGKTVMGTVEAATEREAAAYLRDAGNLPMEIKPARGSSSAKPGEAGSWFTRYFIYPIWTGVNIRGLLHFYRQLATYVAAGMTLSEALRSIGARSKGSMRRIIDEMQSAVSTGGKLSDVIARYPKVFSRLQVSLIRVGENSGMMEGMLERIAQYLEFEISIRRGLAKATFYPLMVFLFIGLLPVLMAWIRVGDAAALAVLISQITGKLVPLLVCILVLKLIFQFEFVRLVWDTIKIDPPIIGTMARKIAMSRFSRAFAVLYSAGLPIAEAVTVAGDACANVALANRIKKAAYGLRSGEGLTASLAKTGALMPMVLDMLSTGERTGNSDAVLQKVADYMDDEVDTTLHKLMIVAFIVPLVIAGIYVALIAVSFYGSAASKAIGAGQ